MSAALGSEGSPVRVFPSERGRIEGIDPSPLIVYGPGRARPAELIAKYSTLATVWVIGLENLAGVLRHARRCVGVWATSRPDRPGEASEALALFRAAHPARALLLYGAHDPNVERAAKRAIEAGADGVVPPGTEIEELFEYAFGVLREVASGAEPPRTVEEHVARLRRWAPRSPFWRRQDSPPVDSF